MLVSCCITCTGTNRNSFIGGESLMFIGGGVFNQRTKVDSQLLCVFKYKDWKMLEGGDGMRCCTLAVPEMLRQTAADGMWNLNSSSYT